jgi:exonuclease III
MKSRKELNTYKSNKMVGPTVYLSILTLNVNDLNFPQTHRMARWFKRQDLTIFCLQEMHDTDNEKEKTHWLKVILFISFIHMHIQ